MFAHYSRDENLIAAIKRGWDVHKATAAIIYKKDYDDVNDEERSKGKTNNFALVYGVGIPHFSELLSSEKKIVTLDEARQIKQEYFAALPNAKTFINSVQDIVARRGYVRNYYMRRRNLKKDEAYKSPNALIQSCAADYIKEKMIVAFKNLNEPDDIFVNIVHDELICDIPYERIDEIVPIVISALNDSVTFRVPITCGCEWSLISWGRKMDYDVNKSVSDNAKAFIEKYPNEDYSEVLEFKEVIGI